MDVKRVEPSFGMAMKYENFPAFNRYIFEHLKSEGYFKFKNLEYQNNHLETDIYVSVIKNKIGKSKLQIEVGPKTFTTGLFNSPIRIMKKATKYAMKLDKEKQLQRESAAINVPRL